MHPSVVPLKHTLDLNTRLFLNCLDGITDEMASKRPTADTNHVAFLAVHALDARCYLARGLGLDMESPFKELLEGAKGVQLAEESLRSHDEKRWVELEDLK